MELQAARKALYLAWTGLLTLTSMLEPRPGSIGEPGIYSDATEQASKLPALVYQIVPMPDYTAGDVQRVGVNARVIVKVLTEGLDKEKAEEIYALVDEPIRNGLFIVDGYEVNSYRMEPLDQPVIDKGRRIQQIGGVYRLIVRKTS